MMHHKSPLLFKDETKVKLYPPRKKKKKSPWIITLNRSCVQSQLQSSKKEKKKECKLYMYLKGIIDKLIPQPPTILRTCHEKSIYKMRQNG